MPLELQINQLTLQFDSSPQPLITDLNLVCTQGWTGIVGENGVGKTTFLKTALGLVLEGLQVTGKIQGSAHCYYCSQDSERAPHDSDDFLMELWEGRSVAGKIAAILEIDSQWYYRWETLSFGERKRFQLAVAIWKGPDILAVDEPTNHLDQNARTLILEALRTYDGIGLIVSHDQHLLDQLCTQTLFLQGGCGVIKPGGVSQGRKALEEEALHQRREYQRAQDQLSALKQEAMKRRRLAENQQKRRSKRGLSLKDNDARYKKNLARITGKDGVGGKLLRQLDGRIAQAQKRLDGTVTKKARKTEITVHGTKTSRDLIFSIEAKTIVLGEERSLTVPQLYFTPTMRVALTGCNGSGKSSLINHILKNLLIPKEQVLYLPQEISEVDRRKVMQRIQDLSPKQRGQLISTVSRLGSDPNAILKSRSLSPGEARKLLLAFGIQSRPEVVFLDEPTNHLDYSSIGILQRALEPLDCAILLVSHDRVFREALTSITWEIQKSSQVGQMYLERFQKN